jgi:hypothetical protein
MPENITKSFIWDVSRTQVIHITTVTRFELIEKPPRVVAHHADGRSIVFQAARKEDCVLWLDKTIKREEEHPKFLRPKEEWVVGILVGVVSIFVCEFTFIPWADELKPYLTTLISQWRQ